MAKFSQSNNNLFLNLYTEVGGQNITQNSSIVKWRLTVSRIGNYYTYNEMGDSRLSLTIDGRSVHDSRPKWRTSGEEMTLASGEHTVSHDSDGTKTATLVAVFTPNNGYHGTIRVSAQLTLSKISRGSTASLPVAELGQAVTIRIDRQQDGFTHRLRYVFGEQSGNIAENVTTQTSWTVPAALSRELPTSLSGRGTLYVDTYNGQSKIGTTQTAFTVRVPNHYKPTLTGINLDEAYDKVRYLIGGGNRFVQILSNIRVNFTGATGSSGATIIGYHAEIVGKNQSIHTNGGTLGLMNYHGQVTIRARVTDSRGLTSDFVSRQVTVLPYFSPILSFTVDRAGTGQNKLIVHQRASIAPLLVENVQRNQLSLTFEVSPIGTGEFKVVHQTNYQTLNELLGSAQTLEGDYPPNQSFEVRGTLRDIFQRVVFTTTVATERVVMGYDKDGRVSVGKPPNERLPAGSLDVAGDIQARDGVPIGFYARNRISDLNKALTAGVYYFNKGCLNQPSSYDTWGYVEVVVSHSHEHNNRNNWIWQTYKTTSGHLFTRYKANSDPWSVWIIPGLNQFYPIGAIYQSTNSTNPAALMGGTWESYQLGQGATVKSWRRTG